MPSLPELLGVYPLVVPWPVGGAQTVFIWRVSGVSSSGITCSTADLQIQGPEISISVWFINFSIMVCYSCFCECYRSLLIHSLLFVYAGQLKLDLIRDVAMRTSLGQLAHSQHEHSLLLDTRNHRCYAVGQTGVGIEWTYQILCTVWWWWSVILKFMNWSVNSHTELTHLQPFTHRLQGSMRKHYVPFAWSPPPILGDKGQNPSKAST